MKDASPTAFLRELDVRPGRLMLAYTLIRWSDFFETRRLVISHTRRTSPLNTGAWVRGAAVGSSARANIGRQAASGTHGEPARADNSWNPYNSLQESTMRRSSNCLSVELCVELTLSAFLACWRELSPTMRRHVVALAKALAGWAMH